MGHDIVIFCQAIVMETGLIIEMALWFGLGSFVSFDSNIFLRLLLFHGIASSIVANLN
jgi:hypothetical protein